MYATVSYISDANFKFSNFLLAKPNSLFNIQIAKLIDSVPFH